LKPKRVVITCKGIKWWQGPIEPLHKERAHSISRCKARRLDGEKVHQVRKEI